MDLGCYPLHWVRALMGEDPTIAEAVAMLNPLGADLSMDATRILPSGVTARVTSSMIEGTPLNSSLDIIGTIGTAQVNNLVFPSTGHSIREQINGLTRSLTVRGAETYDHQLDAVIRGMASGETLPTEGDDPIGNMTAIEAIYAEAGLDRTFAAVA